MSLWNHPRLTAALCTVAVLGCAAAPAVFLAAADAASLGRVETVADPYVAPTPTADDYYILRQLAARSRNAESEREQRPAEVLTAPKMYIGASASLQSMQYADSAAAAAAEKARQEKLAAARQAKIDEEMQAVTDKFETIVAQGSLRQLDWKNALRQLETLKADLKTPEGQHAADIQIRKVNDMKDMQEIFIRNLRGYVFKGKLKGAKVASVNEREMNLDRGKSKARIPWHKFYKDYPGNLNELINHFIIRGRDNARPKLNLKDWADAMTGAALTMQIVCAEVNGAVEKGEQLAKKAVEEFPEYAKTAKEIFPEIEFGETAE